MEFADEFRTFLNDNPHLDEDAVNRQLAELGELTVFIAIFTGNPYEIPEQYKALRDFAVAYCERYCQPCD